MILDTLNNSGFYFSLHPLFIKAFDFLKNDNLILLSEGSHNISGEECFAIVSEGKGKKLSEAKLEAHRKYIDIQYLVKGSEQIGWKQLTNCFNPTDSYSDEKDIIFFDDKPEFLIKLQPGSFAVFLPEDAHAPMISDGIVKKVVVKVKI